jgi:hypothetical protein
MKARTDDTKVCRGCFETRIPLGDPLCPDCHRQRNVETFINAVADLSPQDTMAIAEAVRRARELRGDADD